MGNSEPDSYIFLILVLYLQVYNFYMINTRLDKDDYLKTQNGYETNSKYKKSNEYLVQY